MAWKYRMVLSRRCFEENTRWCGSAGSLYASLSRSWAIAKARARKRELYRTYTSLRLLEPIKLWIKEASRDGLHDYHPVSASPFLSSPNNTVFHPYPLPPSPLSTGEKGYGVMLREISLPVHSSNCHRPPSADYPQLDDGVGRRTQRMHARPQNSRACGPQFNQMREIPPELVTPENSDGRPLYAFVRSHGRKENKK